MGTNLDFRLPNDQWKAVQPEAGQAFLALHTGVFEYFCPNISADLAELSQDGTLEASLDATADRMRKLGTDFTVSQRTIDEETGGGLQQVEVTIQVADGVYRRISQAQVFAILPLVDGENRLLLCLMLTAESDTLQDYLEDFQAFVQSVHPA